MEIEIKELVPVTLMGYMAPKFPQDIEPTWERFIQDLNQQDKRTLYGACRTERDDTMYYYAAATLVKDDETPQEDMVIFNTEGGKYASLMLKNWMQNVPEIAKTFDKLSEIHDMDDSRHSLEEYVGDDCYCMIPIT